MNTNAPHRLFACLLGSQRQGGHILILLGAMVLGATGCATREVNPDQPRANTGYVDFYAESAAELNWEVTRLDESGQSAEIVFSELKPPQNGVLRVAFPPGRYRLGINFLNRVVIQPTEVAVAVEDGRISPIQVTLIESGVAQVRSKEISVGGTAYGRYGRRTKIQTDTAAKYRITALAGPRVPYQRRERMPYAQ